MNILTFFSQQKFTVRVFAVITILSMILSAFPAAFYYAEAVVADPEGTLNTINNPFDNPQGKIQICHWDDENNKFANDHQEVNVSSVVNGQGHGGHTEDIIPPFWHQLDDQDPQFYAGMNWDDDGKEIYDEDCGDDEVVDVCPNLDDVQKEVPEGYVLNKNNECVPEVVDVCPNLDDVQEEIPEGYELNENNECVPKVVDVCPNIEGVQEELPKGYEYDKERNCVPIEEPERCENLLVNGSFEDETVTNSSKWQKFGSVTGWLIEKVSDDSSTTLELHNGWSGNDAAHGDQYAELDGDHSTRVLQPVATLENGEYELKWAFAPRHKIAAEQNQMSVMVNGSLVASEGPATGAAGLEASDWKRGTYSFTADATTTVISFADAGPSNSFGTYLDDAQLCLVKKPEPPCEPERHVFADNAEDDEQGPTKGGGTVAAGRSNPDDATGTPDWSQGGSNGFFSLGLGGWIVVSFDKYVVNVDGDDISIHEATNGNSYPLETAKIEVSQNGTDWETLSEEARNDNDEGGDGVSLLDFDETGFDWIKYVRVTDTTNPDVHSNGADGFDLDTVDATYVVCDEPEEEDTATLHATKIECVDESLLPNDGYSSIDENTATDFLASSVDRAEGCKIVDWEFEWAPFGTSDPGDTMTGSAGGAWTTFTGSTEIPESAIEDKKFWVREVLQEGYIPFTHGPSGNNNSNDVTAELYCHVDAKNYDNFDRVDNPAADGDYYCVAWNVPDRPDYGPYCGDGVQNQEWEQCDGDDVAEGETCTDYCTLDNQCTDLRLMKIDLDESDSVSFDGTLHLGSAGNVIPNGTWFHFDEDGDDGFVAIANAIDGLAIERDTENDKLALAFVGGNGSRKLDIVQGSIMTLGIDLGAVDRSPNPQFKLENGNGNSFDDIFDKNGDEGVDFDLRADTGNDGVTVEVGVGEEYNCDECKAEVEARVVIRDEDGAEIANNGDGNLLPQVILGDGSTVDFGEWFKLSEAPAPDESAEWIDDEDTVTNFDDPSDLEGLFVSREGDGTVKVALYGFHNPGGDTNYESLRATIEFNDAKVLGGSTAQIPGDYKLENHSEADNVQSNDNFDSFDEADDLMSVDFDFWVDTKADGIKITLDEAEIAVCDEDTDPEEDMYLIDGYKFVQEYDYIYGYEGWTIELYEDESLVMSTTTDENGYYYFWVKEGEYEVHEVIPEGWLQVGVQDGDEYEYPDEGPHYCSVDFEEDEKLLTIRPFVQDIILKEVEWESDYRCDFYNQKEMLHLLDGYKYEVEGDLATAASGWTIYATNGSTTLSTTTDMYGYYWFEVPTGMWEVYEEDREGWILVSVDQYGGYYLLDEVIDQDKTSCEFWVEGGIYDGPTRALTSIVDDVQYPYPYGYQCDFYNERTEDDDDDDDGNRDRSSGTRTGRGAPAPMVLGESTTCEFLLDFMQMGIENDPFEVTKLQMFLKIVMQYDNPVTGFFDAITDANVKRFQEQYRNEILDPWFMRGIVPHNEPTGFVYKTTKWKINDIVCPGWDPYPSFDGENLDSNIDL